MIKGIRNFKCSEGVVKRIPNIKRLKLEYFADDDDDDNDNDVYFVSNMKYLCGLESLSVKFKRITPVQNITFPHSLKKLTLCLDRHFKWDNMLEKIGSLPFLEMLKIYLGYFREGKWEIAKEQFPCLKFLKLSMCGGFEYWIVSEEDSAILPRLEHLHIDCLGKLKEIPSELGNIDTLKIIELTNCGDGAVNSAKDMFDEQVELQGGEDQLSLHVVVNVREGQKHLLSLAGPNFYVNLWPT